MSSASELERQRTTDPVIGCVFDGRYQVLRMIGEGGMGIVYEAEHIKIDKRVAIKVLREDFTRRPDVVARFQQEAKSASRIGHPHIIDVSDFGQTPSGASYIVMEMLQGEDLADLLAREYVLSPLRATGIVYQACKALAAAHQLGIVHRDLKPENLFILQKGGQHDFVKIVDFGVAKMTDIEIGIGGRKLTTTGMIFGTPEYMSPEQARGDALDHRVDIYAMGVILYELVTGRVPFEGENFMEILNRHGRDPIPALTKTNPATHVSADLEAVIMRALTKDQRLRFQTMDEMADALEGCPEMPPRVPTASVLPPAWSSVPPAPPPVSSAPPQAPVPRQTHATPLPKRTDDRSRQLWERAALLFGAMAVGVAGALLVPRLVGLDDGADTTTGVAALEVSGTLGGSGGPSLATVAQAQAEVRAADPALVEMRVVTRPAGAQLEIEGQGPVCDATPCTVSLPSGTEARLLARRGTLRAQTGVTAAPGVEVRMVLRGRPVAKQPERRAAVNDDLKVPAIFR